jgi:hypothetical protein
VSPFLHVANVTREVHDALMRWARRLLQEAGLESLEVYGQFPPVGTVASHLVLFPYRVGPEPKMVETSSGASLLGGRPLGSDRVNLVPRPWLELGAAFAACLQELFSLAPLVGHQRAPTGDLVPYPRLSTLPKPLQAWYLDAARGAPNDWLVDSEGMRFALPPALTWHPGIVVTARYIAVVGEPGRGTSERTSVSAPVSLSALSVLTAGLHMDNMLSVRLAPLPCEDILLRYGEALALCFDGGADPRAGRLTEALRAVQRDDELPVQIHPIHDLTNHEFALLMQALQKPLQAALNLQLRLHLAAQPLFTPSAAVQIRASNVSERR